MTKYKDKTFGDNRVELNAVDDDAKLVEFAREKPRVRSCSALRRDIEGVTRWPRHLSESRCDVKDTSIPSLQNVFSVLGKRDRRADVDTTIDA
jgi:hypothetical protein